MNRSSGKYLTFYFWCTASKKDQKRSCIYSATLRIVSQKRGKEDLIGKRNYPIFNGKKSISDLHDFITFEQLMDPNRGFYQKEEDKETLAIDIDVEEQKSEKFDSDPNKSNGKIVMEIGKLSEFEREICGSERKCEMVQINGLPWKILAEIKKGNDGTKNNLAFYLWCTTASKEDENWSCKCLGTFQIISQMNGAKDFRRKFNEKLNEKEMFTAVNDYHGFNSFITFAELMDPSKGLYDREGDKVKLAIMWKNKNQRNRYK